MGFGLWTKSLKGGTTNPSKLILKGKNNSETQSDILKPSKKIEIGEMERLTMNGKHRQKLKK